MSISGRSWAALVLPHGPKLMPVPGEREHVAPEAAVAVSLTFRTITAG